MEVFASLRRVWSLSFATAGLGLFNTVLTVRFAGASNFADFSIDLAKLSLLVLLFELVPSPFAIFRSQQDPQHQEDLASFAILGVGSALALCAATASAGFLEAFSLWMLPYAGYVALQRYLDVRLQALGRLNEYFELVFVAALVRVLLLFAAFLVAPSQTSTAVLWAALAVGSWTSMLFWIARRPHELQPVLRRGHRASLRRLFSLRREYQPYYLNAALKRLRDTSMPLLCAYLVPDRVEVARYLLAYRGLDFVLGQLRVVEAALNSLVTRLRWGTGPGAQFFLLAVLGQMGAFAGATLLGGQAGLEPATAFTAFIASFFVYPYTLEILRRSDAYASGEPLRVSISLCTFVAVAIATVLILWWAGLVYAWTLMLAPVLAQSAAALSYLLRKPR